MGLLTVIEFAEKYDITRNNVYTYKNRGKLIIVDGFVDEQNQLNADFIAGRIKAGRLSPDKAPRPVAKGKGPADPKKIKEAAAEVGRKKKEAATKATTEKLKRVKESTEESNTLYRKMAELDRLKKIELEEKIRLARMRNDRVEGKLIQTELVKQILGEVIFRYKTAFLQQAEQLLRDTLNEAGIENKKLKEACKHLIDIANSSSKIAVHETKKMIAALIEENTI